ncbi:hypothetical protein CEV32_3290 [Brucella rhizosphaerae]|uniref:Uncharacterized protein n=1 Tax=Brucella rhizosphaerae TaxID=571254 RepID=A0A256FUE6_9HYPH|nr:hypothetical protein CEV32_3290 [Brucella rhizosphaerae]
MHWVAVVGQSELTPTLLNIERVRDDRTRSKVQHQKPDRMFHW